MTVTPAILRTNFPEFEDTAIYPDVVVQFWLGYAIKMLPECRWGDVLDEGVQLMTAHQLVLAARAGAIAAPQSAKAVDKVSVSYDTGAVTIENAGHWNGTSYGIQFYMLARMMGAGPIQL